MVSAPRKRASVTAERGAKTFSPTPPGPSSLLNYQYVTIIKENEVINLSGSEEVRGGDGVVEMT